MVQPVAPSSTCACIVDPIVNSAPYQLISGACSAIGSLAHRIMNFVSSIFAVIANFVRSCFCGAAAATPPAAAAATPAPAPRAGALAGPIPVAPTGVNVAQEGKEFLRPLLRAFIVRFDEFDLMPIMQNAGLAKTFLANLLVHDLVMERASLEGIQLPFMVTRGMHPTPITFIASVVRLRASFEALDADTGVLAVGNDDDDNNSVHNGNSVTSSQGTDDDQQDSRSEEGPQLVTDAVLWQFVKKHLLIDVPAQNPSDSTEEVIEEDVFDANPDNADSDANVFYAQLNTLAGRFADPGTNPTFAAAAEALRVEYIRLNQNI